MIGWRAKNGESKISEWKDVWMKGVLNHGCALCVNAQSEGAHRQRLCDLKAKSTLSSNHPCSYVGQRPAARCCLTGLAPTLCHGQHLATFLPGSKALCVHTSRGHYDRGRAFIIFHVIMPQHELQTRSSDSMGRSCRAEPHSGPFLELYCLWHVFSYLV